MSQPLTAVLMQYARLVSAHSNRSSFSTSLIYYETHQPALSQGPARRVALVDLVESISLSFS